ncbi:hypothetical protein ACOI2Q_07030 [Shewanella algae]|uniref:hypothetical protein n=1 Tax=Shewanella algae TaxID=38313 RepID=UPI0030054B03
MRDLLINLAELHFEFGLIGRDELNERISVALWLNEELLSDVIDPRNENSEGDESHYDEIEGKEAGVTVSLKENSDDWIEFLFNGVWVFTKADADSYPSVPHGHFQSQTRKWPKLNPYTGRVFSSKHQEDTSKRLSKKQMRLLWRDEKFRSFCREMIVWYRETHKSYRFPVSNPCRLPIW